MICKNNNNNNNNNNNKLDFIKNFSSSKDVIKERKKISWKKIFTVHISDKDYTLNTDTIDQKNVSIIEIPEWEEKEEGAKNLVKGIMVENFPNLRRDMYIQAHEACRTPNKFNPKRTSWDT